MAYRRSTILLAIAMFVSVIINGYQSYQISLWENAFYKQVSTTFEIEMIFKQASSDTSYDNMLAISKALFKGSVAEVKADNTHIKFGADEKAIQISESMLLFKNGLYYGSKVHVTND